MDAISIAESLPNRPGWLATFDANFYAAEGETRLGETAHFGPLRVQRPFFPEGADCLHLYILHPPGGLVGGDVLRVTLHSHPAAHCLITTPSAGKFYRNITSFAQQQSVNITVDDGAVFEYFPQENIIFDGAKAELETTINISGSGLFCGWEISSLGRYESGDALTCGSIKQTMTIFHDHQRVFIDHLSFQAPSRLQVSQAGLQGRWVIATFVINQDLFPHGAPQGTPQGTPQGAALTSERQSALEALLEWRDDFERRHADIHIVFTQKPGIWIARALGDVVETIRIAFEYLWSILRPLALGRPASPPRIWRT